MGHLKNKLSDNIWSWQSRRTLRGVVSIAVAGFLLVLINTTYAQDAQAEADQGEVQKLLEEVSVMGSRRAGVAVADMPSPVTIIGSEELANQGPLNMSDLLRATVPSFNVSEQPISGTASSLRPANLRGLSPDHVLILVNGKRRHRAADVPTFGTSLIIGSQGPDLASIPSIAIKSVQVLRDGAAAQYGADAIAGVINFILRDDPEFSMVEAKVGQYSEGDGELYSFAGTFGMPLGNEGYITFSAEWSESNSTDRARKENLTAIQALIDAGVPEAADENVVWGSPDIDNSIKLFVNMAVEAGDNAELYGWGSYANRDTTGGMFYRASQDRDGIFTSAGNRLVGDLTPQDDNYCPGTIAGGGLQPADLSAADFALIAAVAADPNCFTWANVFPGGYSPEFGSNLEDASLVLGLRGETAGNWIWDVSAGYGSNEMNFHIYNSTSPSFGGPNPKTSFDDLGGRRQQELVFNVDLTKEFEIGLASPLNVAFGYQYHREEWSVQVGQPEAFEQGPLFDQGFASGSDGYYGYNPTSAGSWSRDNNAFYVDLEADVTETLVLGVAVRYEDFSDLGNETTAKLSGLWHVTDNLGLRGTVSTGFHAPTPAQQNLIYAVTEGDGDGNLTESGIIPAYTSVAQKYGALPSAPETSNNYSVGLVYESDHITVTLDAYSITVSDRLSLSNSFLITEEDRMSLAADGMVGVDQMSTIQFFTNDFETETNGIDLIMNYPFELGDGLSNLTLAANWNDTEVTKRTDLTSDSQVFSLEKGLPDTRASLTWNYSTEKWRGLLRGSYYGPSISRMFNCCNLPAGSGFTVDTELGWSFTPQFEVAIGGQNIFNDLPKDVSDYGFSGAVGTRYAPETPWGFNGAFYYLRATYRL